MAMRGHPVDLTVKMLSVQADYELPRHPLNLVWTWMFLFVPLKRSYRKSNQGYTFVETVSFAGCGFTGGFRFWNGTAGHRWSLSSTVFFFDGFQALYIFKFRCETLYFLSWLSWKHLKISQHYDNLTKNICSWRGHKGINSAYIFCFTCRCTVWHDKRCSAEATPKAHLPICERVSQCIEVWTCWNMTQFLPWILTNHNEVALMISTWIPTSSQLGPIGCSW